MIKYQATLKKIQSQLSLVGDLPVFSATLNRIQQLSSSKESDAMLLAVAILKDANLSAKLLRVANTSEFNRGAGQVTVISRAVVLLGFDRIKNLSITLKLIESFKDAYPETQVETLLLRAFMTASLTRELAEKSSMRDIEESFLCGLLFNLGELVVACTLPELYEDMQHTRRHSKKSWAEIQLTLLGGQFSDIGQDLAQNWGFPSNVVKTMDEMSAEESKGTVHQQYLLIKNSHQLIEKIYGDASGSLALKDTYESLRENFSITDEDIEASFDCACKQSSDMVEEYGIAMKTLVPKLQETGDPALDDVIRRTSYYFHTRQQSVSPAVDERQKAQKRVDQSEKLLKYLSQLAEVPERKGSAHDILSLAVQGIKSCTQYDRVMFAIYKPEPPILCLKLAEGNELRPLERFFSLTQNAHDLKIFLHVIRKGMTLMVTDLQEPGWKERIPGSFCESVSPRGFIVAPVIVNKKTIGLVYADREWLPLVDEDFSTFSQLLTQARIALSLKG